MGVPPLPHDPNQPYAYQPPVQGYTGPMPPPPQPQQVVYVQTGPMPVPAKKGMTRSGHGFNWTLILLTGGMWLPCYWGWWATVRCVQMIRNHRNRKRYFKVYD
jgi:hypothetical protein